ncbi:MAG: hypothetical protein U0176_04760 [Bacteroidia bacterium]
MLLLVGMGLNACEQKACEVREAPNSDVCVEMLMAVHSSYEEMERLPQTPMDFEAIKGIAFSPQCLGDALGYRKYVLHYYQHHEDRDEEIVPVKFPLYWKLDSTAIQTEGTYRVDFKSEKEVEISFHCDKCDRIDINGKLLASRIEKMDVDFTSKTEQVHKTPDWSFNLQPRRADLSKEVGKTFLIRIESRESYLKKAPERLNLIQSGPNSFKIQYRDGLDYRATDFASGLGKSLALIDQARLDSMNTLKLKAVQDELAKLGNANPSKLDSLKREENRLKIELDAILPRILVITRGAG